MTKGINPIKRVKSLIKKPAGKHCNARRQKSDHYCNLPASKGTDHLGTGRCKYHGGVVVRQRKAKNVYQEALTIEDRSKMESFIEDASKIDNEVALSKLAYFNAVKDYHSADIAYKDYMENTEIPDKDDDDEEYDNYHITRKQFELFRDKAERRMNIFLDKVNKTVETNTKNLQKVRYTLSITQVNQLLINQTNVMAEVCRGCRRLPKVVEGLKKVKITGTGELQSIAQKFKVKENDLKAVIESPIKKEINNELDQVDEANFEEFDGDFPEDGEDE